MTKIALATFGSLGDLHPKLAIALELKARGHDVTVAAMHLYREKIEGIGLRFHPMAPHLEMEDKELAKKLMDLDKGPENMMRLVLMPSLREMYNDLLPLAESADLLITGEVVLVAKSLAEKTGVPWISTSLMPLTMFSSHDPNVYPNAGWYESLRFMPAFFHDLLFKFMSGTISGWFEPYREFRRSLGLDPDHDAMFRGKYSDLLHLALFSRVLAEPQPDWPTQTKQTGFCFYDGKIEDGSVPEGLNEFLDSGEPPIVFTLGSAAALDAGTFFHESIGAAKTLGRRALLLYGRDQERPEGLGDCIAAFEYAPYSLVFPRAAVVVHQGGVGTTGQVLRAGVPHLIMPYSHDQPDNAARCRRLGVAEVISRHSYTAESAAQALSNVLADKDYVEKAARYGEIVRSEHGTATACDAIEGVLNKIGR